MMTDLAIIAINYKSSDYTIDCLTALAEERAAGVDFVTWLLDNASGDDSVERIQDAIHQHGWEEWVRFIAGEKNLGFAGGNNAMLELILKEEQPPDCLLLLNNDTVVHPGCLNYCIDRVMNDDSIALMSCMLRNADGSVQNVARKMPTPVRETLRAFGLPYLLPRPFGWADLEDPDWDRETTARNVEWVGGAFMCMRMTLARKTGLFDTDFFFYGEDMEFCHRMHREGSVFFDPAVSITHFGGASSDGMRLRNSRRDILRWKARFLVQEKCYGRFAARWSRAMYITAFFLHKMYLLLRGRCDTDTYEGVSAGLRQLCGLYRNDKQ